MIPETVALESLVVYLTDYTPRSPVRYAELESLYSRINIGLKQVPQGALRYIKAWELLCELLLSSGTTQWDLCLQRSLESPHKELIEWEQT